MAGANINAINDWIKDNRVSKNITDSLLEFSEESFLEASQIYTDENLFNNDCLNHLEDNDLSVIQQYMQENYLNKNQLNNIKELLIQSNKINPQIPVVVKGFVNGFRYKNYLYTGSVGRTVAPILPIVNEYDIFDASKSDVQLYGNPFSDSTKHWKLSIRVLTFSSNVSVRVFCGNGYKSTNVSYAVPYFYISKNSNKIGMRFSSYGGSSESENNIFGYPLKDIYFDRWIRLEMEWLPKTLTFISRIYDSNDLIIDCQQKDNVSYTLNTTNNVHMSLGTNGMRNDRYANDMIFDLGNTYWTIDGKISWGHDYREHEKGASYEY